MSRTRRLIALAVLALAAAFLTQATPLDAATPPSYYVVLGDSLARGWQPNSSGHDVETTQGYANDVWRALRRRHPGLRLMNFGCGGETATTMTRGGICRYIAGSQLAQAEAFIQAHPRAIVAVTVNIGDNDVEGCFGNGSFNQSCLRAGFAAIHHTLPSIVAGLRAAAGPHVPIAGLSDYDQFLAYWLRGSAGRAVAQQSVGVITRLNALVQSIYRRDGIAVADATPRFQTTDLKDYTPLRGVGSVPVAVDRICLWTWACSGSPVGFDDHANAKGYGVLAQALLAALRPL